MSIIENVRPGQQTRALTLSTIAFTICFAVWTIFSIIGVQIKQELGLNETEFGLLIGTPILTGSLIRLALGVWTDQYGGRVLYTGVMLSAALATFLLTFADTYITYLIAALGVGIAGGSFAVGIAYVSRWYPIERQGTALGIFGVGNVGAAVTKFIAPFIMVAYGWKTVALIWAAAIAIMAIVFWFSTEDDPVLRERRSQGAAPTPFLQQLLPLKDIQVWRFSLYYFFVFGGFVALALWLPRYMVGAYALDIKTAGMLGAMFSIPGSVFRAFGGWLSDRIGARTVMYMTFIVAAVITFILSYPPTDYVVHGVHGDIRFTLSIGPAGFTVLIFILGFFMSLGKAAVYKHIPVYYPDNVGAVGGVVGMIGGLGGFLLPLTFGMLNDVIGIWSSCFMLMFAVAIISLLWMHFAILHRERRIVYGLPDIAKYLPEFPHPAPRLLTEWEPENQDFWEKTGRRIANRNLWISIPALAAVVCRVDGVERGGHQFAHSRLRLQHQPVVLAGGFARIVRCHSAYFLFLHGADFWRTQMDSHFNRLVVAAGTVDWFCRTKSANALFSDAGSGTVMRFRRRQFRFQHGQYQLLFSAVPERYGLGIKCRPG